MILARERSRKKREREREEVKADRKKATIQ